MKKTIAMISVLVMILGLTACGSSGLNKAEIIKVNTAQDAPGYVPGEDYQQNWQYRASEMGKTCATAETGYYHYNWWGDRILYFHDFATDVSVPLCNQPNCEHIDAICNARFAAMTYLVEYIAYYDGNLYVVGSNSGLVPMATLYRISADGSQRGEVADLISRGEDGIDCAIHRGYLYFAQADSNLTKHPMTVYRICLSGDGEKETVCQLEKAYGANVNFSAYGNYLYIQHGYYEDADANGYTGTLYRYHIHTGEMEKVLDGCGKAFVVDEKTVYYATDTQVLAFHMDTEETDVVMEYGSMRLVQDEKYLYCDNGAYVLFLPDQEGVEKKDLYRVTIFDKQTLEEVGSFPYALEGSDFVGVCGDDLVCSIRFEPAVRSSLKAALAGETLMWEPMK